jgi:hypothetical protein
MGKFGNSHLMAWEANSKKGRLCKSTTTTYDQILIPSLIESIHEGKDIPILCFSYI